MPDLTEPRPIDSKALRPPSPGQGRGRAALPFAWDRYPVLAVCGRRGCGKTTLLERLVRRLCRRGLQVAVLQHEVDGITGPGSAQANARLLAAGAGVFPNARSSRGLRADPSRSAISLPTAVAELLITHDIVLIEGHEGTPFPKIWLRGREGEILPGDMGKLLAVLPRARSTLETVEALILQRMGETWRTPPVLGGILIGGQSRRMGSPKQMLTRGGRTWLEIIVASLEPHVDRVVLLGNQAVPSCLNALPRVLDAPGTRGPLGGLLGGFRWAPLSNWVLAACDMPWIESGALAWLLDQPTPGVWAVLPEIQPGRPEPLLAVYDFRARRLVESLARRGRWSLRLLAGHPRVASPAIPAPLVSSWSNANRPEDHAVLGLTD
ncbi:MAG: molybdopterin-guanine dinucleotide biosynthesis protein MobB [Planctomycetota bacterium]